MWMLFEYLYKLHTFDEEWPPLLISANAYYCFSLTVTKPSYSVFASIICFFKYYNSSSFFTTLNRLIHSQNAWNETDSTCSFVCFEEFVCSLVVVVNVFELILDFCNILLQLIYLCHLPLYSLLTIYTEKSYFYKKINSIVSFIDFFETSQAKLRCAKLNQTNKS